MKGALESNRPGEGEIRSLYERHGKALVAYACSYGLDFASAQDAVQQVFLKLLHGGAAPEQLSPGYLFRAVRNTCLNARRHAVKTIPLERDASWLVHREGNRELELTLQSALQQLPEEQRVVVIMHIWSGMTLLEVAQATESPLNTIASRYRYGLEKLRAAFDMEKGEPSL